MAAMCREKRAENAKDMEDDARGVGLAWRGVGSEKPEKVNARATVGGKRAATEHHLSYTTLFKGSDS